MTDSDPQLLSQTFIAPILFVRMKVRGKTATQEKKDPETGPKETGYFSVTTAGQIKSNARKEMGLQGSTRKREPGSPASHHRGGNWWRNTVRTLSRIRRIPQ
jgi:hypothetical protein